MAVPVIVAERIGKVFGAGNGSVAALDDVSFSIDEGEFVTVVGPSGCGKSTLLSILAGLEQATRGRVLLDGAPIERPQPQKIGIAFQDATLLPWKSALANVEFPLQLSGVPAARRHERALSLLELVGLAAVAGRLPHELSGGMRQHVAMARGLVQDPRVLLMDEPFSALDEQTRTRMGAELLRIWEQRRKTVVFITHSINEAIYLADTVLVMGTAPGRILEEIPIDLPRPRDIDVMGSERFGAIRNRIWHLIAGR